MKKAFFIVFFTSYILSILSFIHQNESYGSSTAKVDQEIKNAYIKGDYITTAKLLEDEITQLKEKASEGKRRNFFDLYRKNILLAYIYAWKLNKSEAALTEYQKVIELRQSLLKINKAPPFEFLYIAEIYEMKNDLSKAREYYQTLLNELIAFQEKENDDVSIIMTNDLINIIKYQIDGINLKAPVAEKRAPLLKRIKLSSQLTPKIAMFFAPLVVVVAEYDFSVVRKTDLVSYIKQSPSNVSSMILNYAFVLNASADSVDESAEKAMEAYLLKYPDSYYSLALRYLFYKFYKENEQAEKGEQLVKELEKIAKKRGIEIIIGPDKRFSSPEKTWNVYRNALISGDIDTAMECYVPGIWKERKVFTLLGKEKTKQMGEEMGEIERITGNENRAKYRIKQKYGGQDVSFHINFVNIDGEWKMYEF